MIKLQKADRADCPLLHRLQVTCFASLLEKYRDFDTNPGAEGLERIVYRFEQIHTQYYLITLEEVAIGMLRVCDYGDSCRLSPICILPEYRGRGFARRTMKEIEKLYPEANQWELDTILQEEKLCRFYENLGYIPTGDIRRIKDGMDLVFYRKRM